MSNCTKDQIQEKIESLIHHRMLNDSIMAEHRRLAENHQDFQSCVILEIATQMEGRDITADMLQEGFWDSIKKFAATNPWSGGDDGEAKGKLKAALEKHSDSLMAKQFQALEQDLPDWPNTKETEDFIKGVTALAAVYESIKNAATSGKLDIKIANELIDAYREFVQNANKELKYKHRYFNENEDGEAAPEELNERAFTNYNRVMRVLKNLQIADPSSATGTKATIKQLKWLGKVQGGLDKEILRGIEHLTPKELDILGKINSTLHPKTVKPAAEKAATIVKKLVPDSPLWDRSGHTGDSMDLARAYEQGMSDAPIQTMDKFGRKISDLEPGKLGKWAKDVSKATRTGDIEGLSSIPKLYRSAGSVGKLLGWLGPGTLPGLAAIGLPMVGAGALAGLIAKRYLGKSREGTLKNALKNIENITPDMVQLAPITPVAEPEQQPAAEPEQQQGTPAAPDASDPASAVQPADQAGSYQQPDLDSDREEDEDEKAARLASYEKMQERLDRWKKIAGIIKG